MAMARADTVAPVSVPRACLRTALVLAAWLPCLLQAAEPAAGDTRERVELPAQMQAHMLSNMRDHLAALDEILAALALGDLDAAARIAEARLGMSALEAHGAAHMARFMPAEMQRAGTRMHHAASRFALRAEEGEPLPAYQALSEVTAACVSCHSAYRIR